MTAAVSGPPAIGVKCPWMKHCAPTARLTPQLSANSNEDASVPETPILVIGTATFVVFVTITHCDGLHMPTSTEPNSSLVGVEPGKRLVAERVIGVVAATPLPDRAMLCGEP